MLECLVLILEGIFGLLVAKSTLDNGIPVVQITAELQGKTAINSNPFDVTGLHEIELLIENSHPSKHPFYLCKYPEVELHSKIARVSNKVFVTRPPDKCKTSLDSNSDNIINLVNDKHIIRDETIYKDLMQKASYFDKSVKYLRTHKSEASSWVKENFMSPVLNKNLTFSDVYKFLPEKDRFLLQNTIDNIYSSAFVKRPYLGTIYRKNVPPFDPKKPQFDVPYSEKLSKRIFNPRRYSPGNQMSGKRLEKLMYKKYPYEFLKNPQTIKYHPAVKFEGAWDLVDPDDYLYNNMAPFIKLDNDYDLEINKYKWAYMVNKHNNSSRYLINTGYFNHKGIYEGYYYERFMLRNIPIFIEDYQKRIEHRFDDNATYKITIFKASSAIYNFYKTTQDVPPYGYYLINNQVHWVPLSSNANTLDLQKCNWHNRALRPGHDWSKIELTVMKTVKPISLGKNFYITPTIKIKDQDLPHVGFGFILRYDPEYKCLMATSKPVFRATLFNGYPGSYVLPKSPRY